MPSGLVCPPSAASAPFKPRRRGGFGAPAGGGLRHRRTRPAGAKGGMDAWGGGGSGGGGVHGIKRGASAARSPSRRLD